MNKLKIMRRLLLQDLTGRKDLLRTKSYKRRQRLIKKELKITNKILINPRKLASQIKKSLHNKSKLIFKLRKMRKRRPRRKKLINNKIILALLRSKVISRRKLTITNLKLPPKKSFKKLIPNRRIRK